MKKHIAVLLTLLLATVLVLTACNRAETTDNAIRWTDGETLTYKVSLADYTEKGSSALFGTYSNDGKTYYQDMVISTSAANEVSPYSKNEIVPSSANGTYTVNFSKNGEKWTVTTEQNIQVVYNKTDIVEDGKVDQLEGWNTLTDKIVDETEDTVTLSTSTKTSVTFENSERQRPYESSTETNGFYIGKTKITDSVSKVSTVYDFDKNTATVNVDGKETVNAIKVNAAARFIDSNQITTYIRSLDKTSNKFQDNPVVQVYVPYANSVYNGAFNFAYRQNCMIKDGDDVHYVSLSSLNFSLGAMAYMQVQCLPDNLANNNLDSISTGYVDKDNKITSISKYTISRFRVGNFSYALDFSSLDKGADILTALDEASKAK